MNTKPKESDWKHFRDMLELLRERYLKDKNRALVEILTDPGRSPTEQFWDSFEAMKEESEVLHACLDGYSRSKMYQYMLRMLRHGMLLEEDLSGFSKELQEQLIRHLKTDF
ncbi:hypothetical protein [Coraliomargarita parva]|uniref:hypothetical protein n=1 Tax=Coraliomargarita parva TaxID=3014050 RepID=UPI0022B30A12|nr:hypothetical protein [Coraliomargarita parva]